MNEIRESIHLGNSSPEAVLFWSARGLAHFPRGKKPIELKLCPQAEPLEVANGKTYMVSFALSTFYKNILPFG